MRSFERQTGTVPIDPSIGAARGDADQVLHGPWHVRVGEGGSKGHPIATTEDSRAVLAHGHA